MQFREVTSLCFDGCKVHVTALCGLSEVFGLLKRVINTVAPVPKVIQVDRRIRGRPRPEKKKIGKLKK